jgi:hypothetical protein
VYYLSAVILVYSALYNIAAPGFLEAPGLSTILKMTNEPTGNAFQGGCLVTPTFKTLTEIVQSAISVERRKSDVIEKSLRVGTVSVPDNAVNGLAKVKRAIRLPCCKLLIKFRFSSSNSWTSSQTILGMGSRLQDVEVSQSL